MIRKMKVNSVQEKDNRFSATVFGAGGTISDVPVCQVPGIVHKFIPSKTYLAWVESGSYRNYITCVETKDYPDLLDGDTVIFLDKDTYLHFKKANSSAVLKVKDGGSLGLEDGEAFVKQSDQSYMKIGKDGRLSGKFGPGGSFDFYEFCRDILSMVNSLQVNVTTAITGTSPAGPVTGTGTGTGSIAPNSAADVATLNVQLNQGMKKAD